MTLRFLLLEDNPLDADVIQATLVDGGIDCELLRVETRSNFVTALSTDVFDLILADYALPSFDGFSALEIARNKSPEIPFIFVSGSLGEELAIETLKSGATDYVLKQRLGRLVPSVQRALREARERQKRERAELMLVEQNRLLELIASGHPLNKCLTAVCASVSKLNPRIRACFLLTDVQRLTFPCSITPDFPPSFGQGLKDTPINDLCIGTCGTAVYCGQPVTCAGIANDDRWSQEWRDLCVAHGILACHSAPVLGLDGLPLGSLMLCFDEARLPTDWEYQLAEFGTQVASIVFERDRSNLALRENEARLRAVAANLPNAAVFIVDSDLRYVLAEGKALLGAGTISGDLVGKTLWEALDPTLVARYEPYYRQGLGGEPFSLEHCSHDRYYISHGTPLYNDRGEVKAVLAVSYDISDRKQAEQALRESEEQSRNIVESIDDGFFALDENWRFTYVNQSAETLLSRTPGDLLGKIFWEEFPGLNGSEFEQLYRRVMSDRVAASLVAFYPDHNRWYEVRSYPATNGITIYFRNVTERIQAEAALRESEAALRESESRFRLMVESAKEYAIFTLDLNGIVTSWNCGAQRLLGYQEAEILGCSGRIIFTPEDNERGKAEQERQTALTQGQAENERWHIRKDGSRFWGSGLVMPLLSGADNVQGFVKIMQDKTAQRQANERFRLLYDTTSDLLATEQPLALMDNLFSKLSAQLELHYYYNYMVEEKDNRPMLHLRNYGGISDEAAQAIEWIEFDRYLCGLVAQERRQIVLSRAQISTHPNAQLLCSLGVTAYAGQPLIVRGRLLGTLSFASRTRTGFTAEEIDLLQSTCEQMAIALDRSNLLNSIQQQAQELQQANRIKDEFLAVLSHELRSPLNPILGWSKLLQTGKLDKAKTAQALSVIERNAKLQSELIEDLLDVSRILQGKLSLNVSPVDLVPTIQAAMETVRLAAQAKSIEIQAKLEPNVGQVSGDANRLQQVIWNLLSNAVKFTNVGGRVYIRLERLGSVAQITVSDTGKGIHPDFLPHVFDYFRQEDGATTRRFGGLGLGLAIVRHLVELHGGTVQAESPGEGQGTTFTVKLPSLPTSLENLDSKPSELSLNLHGIKVLVVDDDTDTREFIAFMLSMYGANVTAVASAVEAIAALAQYRSDVLVSDIGMPEVDGYMLMRQLRALPPQGGQIPAIALTAYAGEIDYQQAMLAGFQRHVPKPVDPANLVEAILSLVG